MAEGGAGLHRHPGHPTDMEFHLDDVIGDGEGALCRRLIAKKSVDQDVVGELVPHRDGTRGERALDLRDPRQFPIVDRDLLGGVLSLQRGFRDDDCDRLADMAHPVGWQQHLRTDKDRSTARAGQLHVIAGLRHWIVRDRRETIGGAVLSGKDSEDTGHRQRPPRVNFYDSGVRMR